VICGNIAKSKAKKKKKNKPLTNDTKLVSSCDMVSCIIPVYNEEKLIGSTLDNLSRFEGLEIIVVDGGSSDRSRDVINTYPVTSISSPKGRSHQMNVGAAVAKGSILLFLHADCILEPGALEAVSEAIGQGSIGGCFTQEINGRNIFYRSIEFSGNIRAKIAKVFYGDQGIFVRKDAFLKIGGFDSVVLFEDVIFSRKLKKVGKVCVLNSKVYAEPRRWKTQGIVKATLINWLVTVGFISGIPTKILSKIYCDIR